MLIRVVLGIQVVLAQTVIQEMLEQVPLRVVLVGQAIPVVMAMLALLVQMVTLVQMATQEAQPLLLVTQII